MRRVVQAHRQSYADPIAFRTGERVRLTERRDVWDGHPWAWAIGPDGREGWIPLDTLEADAGGHVACCDFDAIELSVEPGECVRLIETRLGWCWCVGAQGRAGWVPARCLAEA